MGECIWLYLSILDQANWETGIVALWRDEEQAEAMRLPLRTLRRQRAKLAKLGYLQVKKRRHHLEIAVTKWTDPRTSRVATSGNSRLAPDMPSVVARVATQRHGSGHLRQLSSLLDTHDFSDTHTHEARSPTSDRVRVSGASSEEAEPEALIRGDYLKYAATQRSIRAPGAWATTALRTREFDEEVRKWKAEQQAKQRGPCALCGGSGLVRDDRDGKEGVRRCSCRQAPRAAAQAR